MRKEMSNRTLNLNPRMNYLADDECYYLQRPGKPLRFALIGCGMIGMEHIQVTALEGEAVIHGLVDQNERSLASARQIHRQTHPAGQEPRVYASAAEAAADPAIDALIIATPNYTHRAVLAEVLSAGKPILLEKPMATTLEDAAAIARMAEEYESFIQIGLQYRYKSIYTLARREALESPTLGEVKTISMREHRVPFLDKKKQWNKFSEYSGGTLVEKCCHYFDLFNLFAGMKPGSRTVRPVRVFSSGSQAVNYGEFEYEGRRADIVDNAYTVVEYSNGTRACLDLNMFSPFFYEEMALSGEKGHLKVTEMEDGIQGLTNTMEIHRGEDYPSLYGTPRYPQHIEERGGHHGSKFFEHRNFVRRIRGEQTDSARVEEGFWSIVVGAAAQKSLKEGQPVEISDFLKETPGAELYS